MPTTISGTMIVIPRTGKKLVEYIGEAVIDGVLYSVYKDEDGKHVAVF